MTQDFSREGVLKLVEKILGGDTRSVSLRGIPDFAEEL